MRATLARMLVVRQHLRRFVGVLLSVHLCLIAAVPTVLDVDLASAADCTCAHGDEQTCPMHHHAPAQHAPICVFRSAANPHADAVMTLLGPVALLIQPFAFERPRSLAFVTLTDSRPLSTRSIPDAPPPRA